MEITASDLTRFYPLDSMRPEHLELLAKEMSRREWQRGELLFKTGDTDGETHFLIQGEVRGEYPDGRMKTVSSESVQSRYAVGDLQPRRFNAVVNSVTAVTYTIDRRFLEKVLTWDQISRSASFVQAEGADAHRWVIRMLQSRALQKVPAGSLERLFGRFEAMPVKTGQVVIREGDDGDFFYVIKDGAASVSQAVDNGEAVVAYLVRGDSFGEDALLSNNVRNATVTMKKEGVLMRLSKADFQELLKHPVVEWISAGQASILARQGAGILDVRLQEEFEDRAIKGAMNTPLYKLREFAGQLEKSRKYVVYCNTGERSAAGAFILNKLGYEAFALHGGIQSMIKAVTPKRTAPTSEE